jgi:hypothetical protein
MREMNVELIAGVQQVLDAKGTEVMRIELFGRD